VASGIARLVLEIRRGQPAPGCRLPRQRAVLGAEQRPEGADPIELLRRSPRQPSYRRRWSLRTRGPSACCP